MISRECQPNYRQRSDSRVSSQLIALYAELEVLIARDQPRRLAALGGTERSRTNGRN